MYFFYSGFGTSNDGNTARRFFANPAKTSKITGLDERLLRRFGVILQTLACGHLINESCYAEFAGETAAMFVELYGWYNMPVTVHKILVHGADISSYFDIGIGKLSEEAQEARNKDVRRYKQDHCRRSNRIAADEDLMHNLLISSDPKINKFRNEKLKKNKKMFHEVKLLLKSCDSADFLEPFSEQDETDNIEEINDEDDECEGEILFKN
jgi:hypothetical protein